MTYITTFEEADFLRKTKINLRVSFQSLYTFFVQSIQALSNRWIVNFAKLCFPWLTLWIAYVLFFWNNIFNCDWLYLFWLTHFYPIGFQWTGISQRQGGRNARSIIMSTPVTLCWRRSFMWCDNHKSQMKYPLKCSHSSKGRSSQNGVHLQT